MQEPGWYPHQDGGGRVMYYSADGRWLDPFVEFEENAVSMMVPALEKVFEAGFEAGVAAAAKIHGVML